MREQVLNSVLWQTVLGEIEVSVSPASFKTWFKNTSVLGSEDGHITVGVPNVYAKEQLETKFSKLIMQTLKRHGIKAQKLSYRVRPGSQDITPPPPSSPVSSASAPVRSNYGNLNNRYTLDSFVVGSSNELAYAACQVIAREPGSKYNPIFVYGGVGLGKTHLIQAVGNEIVRRNSNARVEYVTCERFTKEFVAAILSKKSFSNHYRSVDVLIVDDIQFIAGKEKSAEEFFHTFNALHQANKQIIVSSDKPPNAIPALEERLRTRFEWGMTVDIQPPDLETRMAILQTKAKAAQINLGADVIDYLANNIQSNIRELEGALTRVMAYCEMRGVAPNLELVEQLISPSKQPSRHITAKQIVDKTARFFNLTIEELTSPRRAKEIVEPRQIAMYLMRSELRLSFPQISKYVGRSDHTTAMHSVSKIENALIKNQHLRSQVHELKERIYVWKRTWG